MQIIPFEFPLNRWILIVAIMLAVVLALPVSVELLSVYAEEDWIIPKSWWESVLRVLSDAVVGAMAGIVVGVVTVWCGARLGLQNFHKGMQHNKKARIYERILEALFAEKDALSSYMRIAHALQDLPIERQQEQKQKEERAREEWGRAIAVAALYLSPKSMETLRKYWRDIDETTRTGGFPGGTLHEINSVVKKVQQQAAADLEMT